MKDIKIIDNFLGDSYYHHLEYLIFSRETRWIFCEDITSTGSEALSVRNLGFSVPLVDQDTPTSLLAATLSGFYCGVKDVIGDRFQYIYRSRLDMTVCSDEKYLHKPHIDLDVRNVTTIFYFTDNEDAETVFYDKRLGPNDLNDDIDFSKLKEYKKVSPKRNRLVLFDGARLHTGHSPTKEAKRVLLNTNFSDPPVE